MYRQDFARLEAEGAFQDAPARLSTISADVLQKKALPPLRWIVKDLISAGLTLLASPPKYGKSWMMLDLGLSVAMGGTFLNYQTERSGVLYLALEDGHRRLKSRMEQLLNGTPAPPNFDFATEAGTLDTTLTEEIETYLKDRRGTGLIIIDTFQRVRGAMQMKEGAYATDYREVGELKRLADKRNIAIVLVHHLRKMKDTGDPFNMISGTNGIMGAADTTMVLTKENRNDENATLSVIGRDVESIDTVLRFNKDLCRWDNLGDADWFTEQQALNEYRESPTVRTIVKLVEQSPTNVWSGTMADLLSAGKYLTQKDIAYNSRSLSDCIKKLEPLLLQNDGIIHERIKHGNAGYKHIFKKSETGEFQEMPNEPVPFEENT